MSTTNISSPLEWRADSYRHVNEPSPILFGASALVMRYGLAIIILWFGLFKFTPTEAQAVQPLVLHSPLLSWLYFLTGVRGAFRVIGIVEIVIALLMAARPISARLSAWGSIGASLMFLTTLSFLVTTPGSWGVVDGMLVPTGAGSFLIKDVLLLGAALWTAAEALAAADERR